MALAPCFATNSRAANLCRCALPLPIGLLFWQRRKGQTVYFNAWGGDDGINAYIDWVGDRVAEIYGVELVHVKLSDTATAVQTVETEFAAGRKPEGGSIDMIWINGANFARLKRQGMLG